jgi:hypothetical protein
MKIFSLQSISPEFKSLTQDINSIIPVDIYQDIEALLLNIDECDGVIINLDDNQKAQEKNIKKIKKYNEEITIIVLCNNLSEKKLQSHQRSRGAADIYFSYPTDIEIIRLTLEESFNSESPDDTRTVALEIIEDHQDKSISSEAQEVSNNLDNIFSDTFADEYQLSEADDIALKDEGDGLSLDDGLSLGDDNDTLGEELDLSISTDTNNESDTEQVTRLVVKTDIPENLEIDMEGDLTTVEAAEAGAGDLDLGGGDLDLGAGELDLGAGELDLGAGELDLGAGDIDLGVGELDLGAANLELGDENIDSNNDLLDFQSAGDEAGESHLVIDEEIGSVTQMVDLSEESDDANLGDFDKTRPILQEELDGLISLDGNSEVEIDDLVDMEPEQNLANSDDSLVTKMREIDKMLNADQAIAVDVLAEDEDHDDADEFVVPEIEVSPAQDQDDFSLDSSDDFIDNDDTLEDDPGFVPTDTPQEISSPNDISSSIHSEHKQFVVSQSEEMLRLGETIKSLRFDREKLLSQIDKLQGKQSSEKSDLLTVQAELDERKIEIIILKKRYDKKIDDLNLRLDLTSNKKDVLVEKNKKIENEFEKIRNEKRMDVNKIKYRERELEEQLDLLKKDTEVQVRNRDHKILELKRRIDTLEFDIENALIKERRTVSDQVELEDKMAKVINTLRSAIGHLEEENSFEERQRLIKKNLDV